MMNSIATATFILFYRIVFFFSSRRRHTRSLCDWSSDVCSSDLRQQILPFVDTADSIVQRGEGGQERLSCGGGGGEKREGQNGRASWRERGEISVVGGSLKKKKMKHE